MTAEELMSRVASLADAAEMVEAIDDPVAQRRRGWDLAGWRYELVPWGVRFVRHGRHDGQTEEEEVFVLAALKQGPPGLTAGGVRVVHSTGGPQTPAGLRP